MFVVFNSALKGVDGIPQPKLKGVDGIQQLVTLHDLQTFFLQMD